MKYSRIAVKVGSNVLTRADGTLDVTRLSALVDQIADLRRRGVQVVLVSSGAVASGRSELRGLNLRLDAVGRRQLFSAVGQAKLINRYYELLREHGIACGQVLTTKENFATRHHYLNQKHCMLTMLDAGVLPIVNENDTVSVTELMFTDNDELAALVAAMLSVDALVILSNIDGLYTGNPADPDSRLVCRVEPDDGSSRYVAEGTSSAGRGGMRSKYRTALKVASEGIPVIIANGKRDHILTDLLADNPTVPHTLFVPSDSAPSAVQKWLAHSESFAKGEVHVNVGAAKAIVAGAASVLPVGVTDIVGDFERDDVVRVVDPAGVAIAYGRIALDSDSARSNVGCRDSRPLIHTDYLYIDSQNI